MEKIIVTEEQGLHKEWLQQSRKSMTKEELDQFEYDLLNKYQHDYGTICHAVASITLSKLNNLLYDLGMTGMQSSFVTWDIINQIFNIEVGARLIKFDDMLFPQYEDKINDKTISSHTFKLLQDNANEILNDDKRLLHPRVERHLQSIISGEVPFGYEIRD